MFDSRSVSSKPHVLGVAIREEANESKDQVISKCWDSGREDNFLPMRTITDRYNGYMPRKPSRTQHGGSGVFRFWCEVVLVVDAGWLPAVWKGRFTRDHARSSQGLDSDPLLRNCRLYLRSAMAVMKWSKA